MSGGIEEPYSIAALPKPLDSENGRILGANVYSLSGSKKRKRREVAVGVDGESVNIYNIQDQTIATSYALPPQSYLAAPPCSIYCRRTKPQQPQRQTYIAVHDGRNAHKARLVSITENLGKPQSDEREPRAPARRERKLRDGKVVSVDVVSPGSDDGSQTGDRSVLVSYDNGNVDCISADISSSRWEHTRADESDAEVEFTAVVDLDTARKGLLKNREDVVALLDTTNLGKEGDRTLPLLIQVIHSEARRLLSIYAIRNATGQTLHTYQSPLEEILNYELPFRQRHGADFAYYELQAGSGMLYQRLGSRLSVVDLSGTTPKLSFELGRKGTPIVSSFTRLSVATVLVVSPSKIGVYDTKYGSLLSSLDYQNAQESGSTAGNQLLDQTHPPLSIVTQFQDLSIVVGFSGTNIVAWQVGDMLDDGRRAKAHGPLLLEVMDKGKVTHEITGTSQKQEKKRKRWEDWKSRVDQSIGDNDIEGLEDIVVKDFKISTTAQTPETPNGDANGHANGYSQHEDEEWDLPPQTFDPQYVNRAKAVYLLGKTFRMRPFESNVQSGDFHLEIAVLSRNILRWLAIAGFLRADEIQLALADATSQLHAHPQVAPGDVMAAIGDAEPSLRLMCDLVSLPVHWGIEDVVRGIQFLIRTLNNQDPSSTNNEPLKALTNGDVIMNDGDLESEIAATITQVDETQMLMESGLEVRSEVCRLLLARLQSFPHKSVVQTMHHMMTDDDIMFFIVILRSELVNGGWTQKYIEQSSDEEDTFADLANAQEVTSNSQTIRTLANLSSCAIDAIGLSGWVVGRKANAEHALHFIETFKNEVSVALEGLFQVESLNTMLGDVKRTAGGLQQQPRRKRKRHDEDLQSPERTWMPVGGRAEPPVVNTWTTKTGRKSKAAIAEEKNRNVGKYSFERIRI
ncbi:hypothetical protein M409DRAFT_71596 [Zasmidium cellare ATCC 36951]|uniref:Utp8 beta-propeller domain-containing protein n=1 Tax=Zasmidium cellare ATCC 36951 TaxID=1080233 RepID=A0A6A6BYC3_ZASCE|nr:uncharacterized protein M409DRAFT_71596 [Zasmidium cellare ATCC 36951]KAF2158529.1 hypothetical protein M409DRAFT_71596 [Zasmidium cellare ATCC 36951]